MNALILNAPLIERAGWMLVHACWQFTAVALALKLLLQCVPRDLARVRYSVSVGALCAMALLAAATFALVETHAPPLRPTIAYASDALENIELHAQTLVPIPIPNDSTTEAAIEPQPSAIVPAGWGEFWQSQLSSAVEPWLAWIVSAWLAGIALASFRPCVGWLTLRRLRRVGLSPVPQHIAELLQTIARKLRVRQAVEIALSSLVEVPIVVGWLRPLVLLPASAVVGLTPAQLQAVLAHELAHIRRHDFFVNVLQTVFETLFFHHPAVWWVSSQMRQEREHCCDDLALELCPDRKEYAQMLLSLEELRTMAPAMSIRGGALSDRVRRILGVRRPDHGAARSASAGLVFLGIALALWLRPAPSAAQTGADPEIKSGAALFHDVDIDRPGGQKIVPVLGSLKGRLVCDTRVGTPEIRDTLKIGPGDGLAEVLVYLVSKVPQETIPEEALAVQAARLEVREGQLYPHVLALRTQQPLVIANRTEAGMDLGLPLTNIQGFVKVVDDGPDLILSFVEAPAPIRIAPKGEDVTAAYVLPRNNPWFAVSAADGSFCIDNLPVGKWEFQIWHELGMGRFIDGGSRMTVEIRPGENKLDVIRLAPLPAAVEGRAPDGKATFTLIDRGENSFDVFAMQPEKADSEYRRQFQKSFAEWVDARSNLAVAEDTHWFRPDPFPQLGFEPTAGDGWQTVRIAADPKSAAELGLDQYVQDIARVTRQLIEKQIQPEGLKGKLTPESRREWWNRGGQMVREHLTKEQDLRLQQLILQRVTYHAFMREDVQKKLELTPEQREQIQKAIEVHELEAQHRQLELKVRIEKLQSALGRENQDLIEAGMKRLREMSEPGARASRRQVWSKIHEILLPAQRATFEALRGPMPESARKALDLFLTYPVPQSGRDLDLGEILIEFQKSKFFDTRNAPDASPEPRPR